MYRRHFTCAWPPANLPSYIFTIYHVKLLLNLIRHTFYSIGALGWQVFFDHFFPTVSLEYTLSLTSTFFARVSDRQASLSSFLWFQLYSILHPGKFSSTSFLPNCTCEGCFFVFRFLMIGNFIQFLLPTFSWPRSKQKLLSAVLKSRSFGKDTSMMSFLYGT